MLFAGVKFWFKTKVSVATLSIDEINIKIKNNQSILSNTSDFRGYFGIFGKYNCD